MANVTVKLFGVFRIDTHLSNVDINVDKVSDIFDVINKIIIETYEKNKINEPRLLRPEKISFKDAVVFINGERCSKKGKPLADNDEIWLLSPASGG